MLKHKNLIVVIFVAVLASVSLITLDKDYQACVANGNPASVCTANG